MQRTAALVLATLLLAASTARATKLVTYSFRGAARVGAHVGNAVIDVNRAYAMMLKDRGKPRAEALANALVPADMVELLQGEGDSRAAALEAIQFAQKLAATPAGAERLKQSGIWFATSEVKLLAPIPNPPHLLAIGLNYKAHIEEVNQPGQPQGLAAGQFPIVFTKEGTVIGPGETIRIPAAVTQPDYEGELGVVIGKPARNVPKEKALEYVAGYTTFNDVSARDFQNRVSQWTLGKSPDTFSAMGPYLVLTDEIPNPQVLRVSTRIGSETLQESNTRLMIYPIDELISYISQVMTIEPGTVIATGTPDGVGMARKPQRWLKPGETVVVVGELSNPVAAETTK
jgi:acylpyruvate hydrolase